MDLNLSSASTTDVDFAVNDLGPLAWVLDELRKSLEGANKALRRFVRDAEIARGSDLAAVDSSQLRIARQQLHQAVGALEMVGLGAPAVILRAMEGAVQKFVQRPDLCTDVAASRVERASFALTEYLESVIANKPVSSLSLFPQYRDVQEVAGAERLHPADLWTYEWRWLDPDVPVGVPTLSYEPATRSRLDQAVLGVVRGQTPSAADLRDICLGLIGAQPARQPRAFWKIAAALFDALATGALVPDVHAKRTVSRVVMQYTALAKGEQGVSDRLALDLLFFCAQATPLQDDGVLAVVRHAWGLGRFKPVDYTQAVFGHYDPALLAQARKRIGAAKDGWSALAGGDLTKLKSVGDQFNLVADSIVRLLPGGDVLGAALTRVIDATVRAAQVPGAEIAMEVATAVLYVEATVEDLDPNDGELGTRALRLAERLEHARSGAPAEPLEAWMEELYRRVSDRQTMGSVVGELRGSLGELEKSLDQFFRQPQDKAPLRNVPNQLTQMRGVLTVLGLDQASQAVQRMREQVEDMMIAEIDVSSGRLPASFERLGNNLGALGFLIDMLNYQPALAKKLFVYDDLAGELRPRMGRATPGAVAENLALDLGAFDDAPAGEPVAPPVPAPAPAEDDLGEDDLRSIFLEEAAEVIGNGREALRVLAVQPGDMEQQTTLRRAFHTLKGSSRMVGLNEFGEAAWSLEQVMNAWLAEQKALPEGTRELCVQAMDGFERWIADISSHADAEWRAQPFRISADEMRRQGRLVPVAHHAAGAAAAAELPIPAALVDANAPVAAPPVAADPVIEPVPVPQAAEPAPAPASEPVADPSFDLSFDMPTAGSEPASVAEPAQAQADSAAPAAPAFEIDFGDLAAAPAPQPEPAPTVAVAATDELSLDDLSFEFPAEPAAAVALAPAAAPMAEAPQPLAEISGIDFDSLAALSGATSAVPAEGERAAVEPVADPVPEPVADPFDFALDAASVGVVDASALANVTPAAAPDATFEAPVMADEQTRVIGDLRISIPLYNVYLNEADEWSRRLEQELGEWALETHRPVPDSAVALAHSLVGSSATVGFTALSELSRLLEHAMNNVALQGHGSPHQGEVFQAAAKEVCRLLHQFAAGFLRTPEPELVAALHAVEFGDAEDSVPPARAAAALAVDVPAEAMSAAAMDLSADPVELVFEPAAEPLPEPQVEPVVAAAAVLPGAARSVDIRAHDDDEIDLVDAVDPDLFPIFEEEAIELLPQLATGLRQWANSPADTSARALVLRALHTLKGSARLAGALRVGEMAHRMESEIERLGSEDWSSAQVEPLLTRFDAVQAGFEALRQRDAQAYEQAVAEATSHVVAQAEMQQDVDAALDLASGLAADVPAAGSTALAPATPAAPGNAMRLATQATTPLQPLRSGGSQTVRVRSQLLDRLVNQAGEVMITRTRLEATLGQLRGSLADLTDNLDRLRQQLRDIELQAESQMQTRLQQAKESNQAFDPLEFDRFTRVQELTRMMAESVNDVATVQRTLQRTVEATEDDLVAQARQTRELQRDLLRTRMVEFDSISERLYRVVRQAAKETGKQVRLDITGGTIEMDRGVLDRMTPAFEHLLRNCVVHGIETPEARAAGGKDGSGIITVALGQEGNDVAVEFRDDGAGLDLGRIRAKAVAQGLIGPDEAIDARQAASLIFMPGFSTATEVTELAGRGIGMDVVRSEVNALGGRIETGTEPGRGSSFRLVLPLTTAVTQVVMLRAGNLSIGVPANLVELVRRASGTEVEQAYNSGSFEFAGERLPFFWAGALLQFSRRSVEPAGRTIPVVIFRSAAQRVALHVDEVLGSQEVVVKNLGPQLARLPGLAGMSVLASGAVALIYNPVALAAVYGQSAREMSADQAEPHVLEASAMASAVAAVPQAPLVLVVDDSITVRRVTQRLLQREGYRVVLAADGLQALERLQDELPTVVLSDIEMPRMDGFDLARNIRNDARTAKLPIVMITSRIAEKHRDHAMELGVDHYLGKPYSEEELLSLVKGYAEALTTA